MKIIVGLVLLLCVSLGEGICKLAKGVFATVTHKE